MTPYILEYAANNTIHRHSHLQIIRNNILAKHKALDQMAYPTVKFKDLNQTTATLKVVACAGRDAGEKRGTKGSAPIFVARLTLLIVLYYSTPQGFLHIDFSNPSWGIHCFLYLYPRCLFGPAMLRRMACTRLTLPRLPGERGNQRGVIIRD